MLSYALQVLGTGVLHEIAVFNQPVIVAFVWTLSSIFSYTGSILLRHVVKKSRWGVSHIIVIHWNISGWRDYSVFTIFHQQVKLSATMSFTGTCQTFILQWIKSTKWNKHLYVCHTTKVLSVASRIDNKNQTVFHLLVSHTRWPGWCSPWSSGLDTTAYGGLSSSLDWLKPTVAETCGFLAITGVWFPNGICGSCGVWKVTMWEAMVTGGCCIRLLDELGWLWLRASAD